MGDGYKITESGDVDSELEFSLDQDATIYTDDCVVIPEKTVFDFDYIDSVFGLDYPVDVSSIDYNVYFWHVSADVWTALTSAFYVDLVEGLGTITIYEMDDENVNIGHPGIEILNSWNTTYAGVKHAITEIELVGKSVSVEFLWSSDSTPVSFTSFDLEFWDGDSWELVDTYVTDVSGMINITEMLPCGMDYRFEGQTQFTVSPDDVLITENYTISSECGVRELFLSELKIIGILSSFFLFYYDYLRL